MTFQSGQRGFFSDLEKAMKPHWDWLASQYAAYPYRVVLSWERYEELYNDGSLHGLDVFQPDEDFVVGVIRHSMETGSIHFKDRSEALLFKLTFGGAA